MKQNPSYLIRKDLRALFLVQHLQGCDPAARDRDGCTPLYFAAAWNRLGAVKLLARIGGSAALAPSKEGRTPVHVAAEQGWSEVVHVLVNLLPI